MKRRDRIEAHRRGVILREQGHIFGHLTTVWVEPAPLPCSCGEGLARWSMTKAYLVCKECGRMFDPDGTFVSQEHRQDGAW